MVKVYTPQQNKPPMATRQDSVYDQAPAKTNPPKVAPPPKKS